jgi:phospholipid/cholesterol/gamma-HCH transport system substrate-binding protein
MKSFSERNPFVMAAIGCALVLALLLGALNYKKLPFVNQDKDYSAYFADAGGLVSDASVQVSGFKVGQVSGISLDGARVLIKFRVSKDIYLGDRTEAAIKTKALLGAKILEVTPRGEAPLSGTIPIDHTASPYQLPDALGDLTSSISGLNTDQLSASLAVLSDTFKATPPQLKVAVQGVGRFSETLGRRDAKLRALLANANKVTTVLAQRSDQVVTLIANTNALLIELKSQSKALDRLSVDLSVVTRQIKGFIADNRTTLQPALDKLNGALTIVDNRKDKVQQSIKKLNIYALSLGETVGSGPFFKAYVANLLPGQFLQPFIDAAFSDLGLDPNVLLPTQRTDPQVGQPGTPPLPLPYPRTGQGGPPRRNLPDAITGKPGDQPCGVPGVALPGPGCYPYREPLPAPPPGGPPPGPPAPAPPRIASTPQPTPSRVYVPAPNEVPPGSNRVPPGSGGGQR